MNPSEYADQPQDFTAENLPRFVISVEDGSIHGEDSPENLELARRIIACFNACEGISTEELENGIIKDMQQVLSDVVPVLQEKNDDKVAQIAQQKHKVIDIAQSP